MRIRLVIVSPKYQANIGYIARTAMNFGIKKLFIVKPRAAITGKSAMMYAKHARALLESAVICSSFDEAIRGCDIVVGTTGVLSKAKANFRNVDFAERVFERIARNSNASTCVALVMGRDDTGLSLEELGKCDYIAFIGASNGYSTLNVSHALAILLFIFTKDANERRYGRIFNAASHAQEETLFKIFENSIKGKKMRNRAAVLASFKRIIHKSQPTEKELNALITALK
ncbi:MAG: RNA methyltransferase [Candidatus Micrarchaeaceae archaeon]